MSEDSNPDDEIRSRWESILAEADIKSVPINFLKDVTLIMLDGTEHKFDILELRHKGFDIKEIEALMEEFIQSYDDEIDSMDFQINIDAFANEIERRTKRLLD